MKARKLKVRDDLFTIFVNQENPLLFPSLNEAIKYISKRTDINLCFVMTEFIFKAEVTNADAITPFLFQMVPRSTKEPAFGEPITENYVNDTKRSKWFAYSVTGHSDHFEDNYQYIVSDITLSEAIRKIETQLEYSAKPHNVN